MMSDVQPVRRALLSVSDKTGLEDFAKNLAVQGVELISTGGTAKALRAAGLEVRDVSELTGFPEMMDGRVKTLHPVVHGGLLALRDDTDHVASMEEHGIGAIDLAVVNLYPFEQTVAGGADYATAIENIDIGGPAMIRAAAKNHKFVSVVVDVADYEAVLAEIPANGGTTYAFRQRLAATAYSRACWRKRCAMAKTRTRRRRFIPTARMLQGLRPQSSIRAKNCPTIILTTRMRPSAWSLNSRPRVVRPWRSSSTQIQAVSRGGLHLPKRSDARLIATAPRLSVGSSH
jgi:phosphoribosylaminoimidazolecarboxamide formyltransferase/IMP cyclohydrolase